MPQKKEFKPEIIWLHPRDLIPYEKNSKVHPKEQIDGLAKAITSFGFTTPIIVDKDCVIVSGHCRHLASVSLNLEKVPVIVAKHLSEDEIIALRIADNKLSESSWDKNFLKFELQTLRSHDFPVNITGFDDSTIYKFLDENIPPLDIRFDDIQIKPNEVPPVTGNIVDDEVPEVKEAITKSGDLWQLGEHLLLCGDCTNKKDVSRLFQSNIAEICFTSPPYSDQRNYINDVDVSLENIVSFIDQAKDVSNYIVINLGMQRKYGELYCYWDSYIKRARQLDLKLLSWNVWDRFNAYSIGQHTAMFPIEHEWIFVFGKEKKNLNLTVPNKYASEMSHGSATRNRDGSMVEASGNPIRTHRSLGTVYRGDIARYTKQTADDHKHPAIFPVEFPLKYIEAMTSVNDFIYEPFSGSGTTIIASEKTGRKCLAMEINPEYCDIAIARYEKFTGKKAEKIS